MDEDEGEERIGGKKEYKSLLLREGFRLCLIPIIISGIGIEGERETERD